MPRRNDLNHVLVIGSGPIVIGQACEFDYSGTQACRVLRAEGLQVSLVNSNPATIMTDPEFADHTYIEPITPAFVERVIAQQAERGNKIDALLATLGGQTALNSSARTSRPFSVARTDSGSRTSSPRSAANPRAPGRVSPWMRSGRRSRSSDSRLSCARPSRWAASARAWRIPPRTSSGWPATGWPPRQAPTY